MSARHEHRARQPGRGQVVGTAGLFERLAARYDAWYDGPAGAAVFPSEVACLRPLLRGLPRPWAEIGVGSGRFAAALGVDVGLDPAAAPLALARSRGIRVVRGAGEQLPFRTGVFGAVLIVVTVCFADDPAALLAEARRVVRHDGAVVLGEVFAESPWAASTDTRGGFVGDIAGGEQAGDRSGLVTASRDFPRGGEGPAGT